MLYRIPSFGAVSLVFTVTMLACGQSMAEGTVSVKARDLKLDVPKSWKQEEPSSSMRVAQFLIPAAEGDKEDATMVVFKFPGGGAMMANINRWVNQFEPEGRKVDLVVGKSPQGEYALVHISGDYGAMDMVSRKFVEHKGWRVSGVVISMPEKGSYFLKLSGPEKTVAEQATALRAAFGGDQTSEKKVAVN
jgi:hypothetical protein